MSRPQGSALDVARGQTITKRWSIRKRRHVNLQVSIALTILIVVALVSVLAPLIAPHDPDVGDAAQKYLPLGTSGHIFGTDEQGRDILSRLIWGGRTSLLIALLAVIISTFLGTVLALVAGFSSARISGLIMRGIDIMFAFPVIIAAVVFATVLGPGTMVVIAAIVFSATPYVTRIIFAEVKSQRGREYVEAAVTLGAGFWSVLVREVLPNIAGAILIYSTSLVGIMIVFSSSLSSLGIGVQPPDADWGRMISEGAKVIISGNIYPALLPGLVVLIVSLAFNWLGDGLRDVLDPHRRRS